ncbi:MAG: hypothetical protein KTM48_00600 [Wolbachia endosymbiont of Pissodes strobi]|nr:hypothetical protein [Wolbachia endosymbiont of Pissodes strobi]
MGGFHPRHGHREDDREEVDLGCRRHLRADSTQRQGSQQRMRRRRLSPKHKMMTKEQNSREAKVTTGTGEKPMTRQEKEATLK